MTNQLMLLAMVMICKESQYTDCLYDGECLLFPHSSSLLLTVGHARDRKLSQAS